MTLKILRYRFFSSLPWQWRSPADTAQAFQEETLPDALPPDAIPPDTMQSRQRQRSAHQQARTAVNRAQAAYRLERRTFH